MKNMDKNKLVAEFMRIRVMEGINNGNKYYYYNNSEMQDYDALPDYYTSWDCLIPVVHKCLYGTYLKNIPVNGEWTNKIKNIESALLNCEITNLFDAVVEFINWYNENK